MLTAAAIALSLHAPQGDGPSLEEELAALVERTNRIETLHLVYEAESEVDGEAETMTVELVYRAPDLGRMRVTSSKGVFDQWIVGDRLFIHAEGRWQSAEMHMDSAGLRLLGEHFPREPGALGPGVAFGLTLRRQEDEVDFNLQCVAMPGGRDRLLGWIGKLQRGSGVVVEQSDLRLEEDGLVYVVARDSGLLRQVQASTQRGWVRFALREARVDESLDPAWTDLPEAARAAPESEELARAFRSTLRTERLFAFGRVEGQLASGKREWNALARRQWEEVLEVMHGEPLLECQATTIERLRASIPEGAERSKRDRGEEDSPERRAWEEKVAEARTSLASHLDEGEAKYRASIEALTLPGVEPRQELLDVEAEVIAGLWDELVREPMLALFDESFAAAAK